MRRQPERPHRLGPQRERRRRPAARGRRPDDGEPRVRGTARRARRPDRLGRRPGLRAERRSGEPVRHRGAGRRGLHGLRRPHDHALARKGRGAGRQADRVRLVVSARARADLRPGQRPAGRKRPAALEDLGHRVPLADPAASSRDRRAADQLPGRSRQPDRLVRTLGDRPGRPARSPEPSSRQPVRATTSSCTSR